MVKTFWCIHAPIIQGCMIEEVMKLELQLHIYQKVE